MKHLLANREFESDDYEDGFAFFPSYLCQRVKDYKKDKVTKDMKKVTCSNCLRMIRDEELVEIKNGVEQPYNKKIGR